MYFPKHYSLVKDHDDHFEIHDKRDNKKFKVAKKSIHPANQIKIMKLQKLAEGGIAEDDGPGEPAPDIAPQPSEVGSSYAMPNIDFSIMPQAQAESMPPASPLATNTMSLSSAAPTSPSEPQGDQPAPQQAQPMGSRMPTAGDLDRIRGQEAQGINMQAQGQMDMNKQMAQAYEAENQRAMKAQALYEQHMNASQQHLDSLANDIASTKVDPGRLWKNASTGAKIGTALSVILGGLGQGMSHSTHNMAWDAVQGAIDKDIDAQKADLGKKQSLLSDNLRIQGNLTQAENATRLQYGAILQGKIAKIAAQSQDPIIQGMAQQKLAQLKMADIPMRAELAKYQTQQQLAKQAGGLQAEGGGPVNLQKWNQMRAAGMINSEDEKALTKEANELAEGRSLRDYYHRTFNELNSKVLAGHLTPGQRESAIWTIAGKLQHASAGRFNLEDAKKQAEAMFPGVGDWKSTSEAKLRNSDGLFDTLEAGAQTLDRFGLKVPYKAPHPNEGKVASDAKGNKLIMQGGKWVPHR